MKSITLFSAAAGLLASTNAQQFVMYTPPGDDTSVQRADPIITPGKISPHVHQIFGSNAFAPEVSYESLQKADCTTVADASNNGNADDNSVYWHPALYMETLNGTGYLRVPTNGHKLYYRDAGIGKKRNPFEFPHGFRMLAGNPFLRAAPKNLHHQNITQWICHEMNSMNQGTSGGFPQGVGDCPNVDGFNGAIHFPHCWNGNAFNPTDPTAHIVYPDGDIQDGTCPASHPTRLPHIFIENTFNLDIVFDQVKPNSFVLSMGDNTGFGWHADFFSGWKDGAIPALLAQCPQGGYGNEDIGLCPNFKKRSIPASECKLKTAFKERVTLPGKDMPGCNPISDQNPAPMYAAAPLGTYTTDCKVDTSQSDNRPTNKPAPGKPHRHSHSKSHEEPSHTPAGSPPHLSTHHTHKPYTAANATTISCPDANNAIHTFHNKAFRIECGIDHAGGDLKETTVSNFQECIAACAMTKGCVDVSLSGVACYMKSMIGERVVNGDVWGARLVRSKRRRARGL